MSKHTPGPWTLQETTSGGAIVSRGNVQSLQIVPTADARLIAAAPDLLEALKAMVAFDEIPNRGEYAAVLADVLAAIAKAEGK